MRRPSQRFPVLPLVGAFISAGIALSGSAQLVGHTVRWVHVISIFAGGFGSGVGFVRAKIHLRQARDEARLAAATTAAIGSVR